MLTIDDIRDLADREGWNKVFPGECGFEFVSYEIGDLVLYWHEHSEDGDTSPLILAVTYPHAVCGRAVVCWRTDEWDHGSVETARDFVECYDLEVPA